MSNRPNDSVSLNSQFLSGQAIDTVSKKWPTQAQPLIDTTKYDATEKLFIPLTNRVIRSKDFNTIADCIARIQNYIAQKAGTIVVFNGDGTYSIQTGSGLNYRQITAAWDTQSNSNSALTIVKQYFVTPALFSWSYQSYMQSLGPVHWWRFTEGSPLVNYMDSTGTYQGRVYADSGSGNVPLNTSRSSPDTDNRVAGVVYDHPYGRQCPLGDSTTNVSATLGASGQYVPMSISFWLKEEFFTHGDADNYLGLGFHGGDGWFVYNQSNDIWFVMNRPSNSDHSGSANAYVSGKLYSGVNSGTGWLHFTITVSTTGHILGYCNGVQVFSVQAADNQGVLVPDSGSNHISIPIEGSSWQWPAGNYDIDDFSIFNYELTPAQVDKQHYLSASNAKWNVDGYNFVKTIPIPSIFGTAPFSSNSFGVALNSKIIDYSEVGWNKSPTRSTIFVANSTPFIIVSSGSTDLTSNQIVVCGKPFTMWPPVTTTEYKSWSTNMVNGKTLAQYLTSGTAFSGYSFKPSHPSFSTTTNVPSAPTALGGVTNSDHRVEIYSSLSDSDDPTTSSTPFPYQDITSHRGQMGGYFTRHKLNPTQDTYQFSTDVGIEFTYHGINVDSNTQSFLDTTGGYFTKSGVFLRLVTNQNSMSRDIVSGVDYDNLYPNYSGYLLRFNANPIPAGIAYNVLPSLIGSVCIMKVQYEQFGSSLGDNINWWDRNSPTLPVVGTTYQVSPDSVLGNAPTGQYTVLGYCSTHFSPTIGRDASNNVVVGSPQVLRFSARSTPNPHLTDRVIRSTYSPVTLTLELRGGAGYGGSYFWQKLLTVVDTSPIVPLPGCGYIPSGVYSKGIWTSTNSTKSGISTAGAGSNTLSLSNLADYSFIDQTVARDVEVDIMYFGLASNSTSVPTIS